MKGGAFRRNNFECQKQLSESQTKEAARRRLKDFMIVNWGFIFYLAILLVKAGIQLSSRLLQVDNFWSIFGLSLRNLSYPVAIWNERIFLEHLFKPKLKSAGRQGFAQEANKRFIVWISIRSWIGAQKDGALRQELQLHKRRVIDKIVLHAQKFTKHSKVDAWSIEDEFFL